MCVCVCVCVRVCVCVCEEREREREREREGEGERESLRECEGGCRLRGVDGCGGLHRSLRVIMGIRSPWAFPRHRPCIIWDLLECWVGSTCHMESRIGQSSFIPLESNEVDQTPRIHNRTMESIGFGPLCS